MRDQCATILVISGGSRPSHRGAEGGGRLPGLFPGSATGNSARNLEFTVAIIRECDLELHSSIERFMSVTLN